ncbi:hypothetical protein JCM10908_000189 [Rhodotorula pacifica]|uniref:GATA-type transcription factor n=1 Tax=Rhodotorula pacifica TaxID=1495444 RepID=UPI00317CBCA8
MQATAGTDSDVCFSDFIDESAYHSGGLEPGQAVDNSSPAAAGGPSAHLPLPGTDSHDAVNGVADSLGKAPHSASTPSASTASTGSPRQSSDAQSPYGPTESALTSAPTSPPPPQYSSSPASKQASSAALMDPNAPRPEGLEQFAAAWHAHQQALAFHTDQAAALQAAAIAAAAAGHPFVMPPTSGASQPASPFATSFPHNTHLQAVQPPQPQPQLPPVPSTSMPFYGGAQLPNEWIQAANLAQGYSGTTTPVTVPGFPPLYPQGSQPNAVASPLQSLHQLGQAASPVADPGLYALHASLDMQARLAAYASATSPAGSSTNPATDFYTAQSQLLNGSAPSSSAPSPVVASSAHFRSPSGPAKGKAVLRAAGKAANSSQGGQRLRSAKSSQQGSPLASPAATPNNEFASHPAAVSQSAMHPPVTHQRPLPAMPPARIDTTASPASTSAAVSPSPLYQYTNPPARPSALGLSSNTSSTVASPLNYSPPPAIVDYDFSSLEQDLDRFSSAGGFASAAAAAIASVSPTSTGHPALPSTSAAGAYDGRRVSSSRPHDAYGVGGYGGASTPRLEPGALPSPRILTDVLGESVYFPPPGSAKGSSPAPSGSAGAGSAGQSPAAGAGSAGGSSAAAKTSAYAPSPAAESSSPAGSTILDEESAEALSRKDPIAAQVWRMFHKAKNTMPNGARMENLTWRLMSMTLKKRKEDGSAPSGSGSLHGTVHSTPDPLAIPTFAELAQQRSTAIPTNVSAPSSNAPSPGTEARRAEEEEGRDTVQPLESVGASSGRIRAARERERERLSSIDTRGARVEMQQAPDHEEEERGRRRRGRGENLSKSASATPESEEQTDDIMDWRALSKSRSRSRAPDMMDWRGQSRSRSRAPDFRVSAAPPAVDSTNAVANFSRFFDNASLPSPILEQDGSPLGSQPPVTQNGNPLLGAIDVPSAQDANSAALVELATSLGLSPQDQATLFGSAAARFDGHSLLDLPSPPGMPTTSNIGSSNVTSPTLGNTPQTFAFPQTAPSPDGSGPDPNLAAIENTLNQLISLHQLSTPSPTSQPAPEPTPTPKSPASPRSTALPPPPVGDKRERTMSSSSSKSSAQQHLQQFITGRKASSSSGKGSSASSSRRVSAAASSPYANATTLAQAARPFSFGAAASAAAAAASASPSASGISLARPQQVSPQPSQPSTPYVENGLPAFLSGSAPPSALVGSPEGSLYGSHTEASHSLYDYFNSPYQPAPYLSPNQLDTFGSAPAGVDPSQLLNRSVAPSSVSSEPSSWGISSHSVDSSATGAISPLDEDGHKKASLKAKRPTGARSASASSLPTLANKVKANTSSRPHSRSNTISLPGTIKEGHPLDVEAVAASFEPESIFVNGDAGFASPDDAEDGSSASAQAKAPQKLAPNGEPLRCINCQTENTPLWRRGADGNPLCNACGLFRNLHGVDRPAKLNTGVIKKRNRTRGPKDPNKKTNRARRNSAAGPEPVPSSSSARKDRVGAGAPYPNAAARAAQQGQQGFDELV